MQTETPGETLDHTKRINDYGERHNLTDEDIAFFQTLVDDALRNERERCAKIAKVIPDSKFDLDHEPALTEQQIRNGIAAAIGKGR